MKTRIGIVGYGYIARSLIDLIEQRLPHCELVFVHARDGNKIAHLPVDQQLIDLDLFEERSANLIIEAAHPIFLSSHGTRFLKIADFMPLSSSGLADDRLLSQLIDTATEHGHSLLIPRGALPGLDDLIQWREHWRDVLITFRKPPGAIDFSDSGIDVDSIVSETIIYEGPVRGIAEKFPRNVNAMVTCALATIGLDRCRAKLVVDPELNYLVAEVDALSNDGDSLRFVKKQGGKGVSGGEMIESLFRSVSKACAGQSNMEFV
jgi:aspartate dehydrogenase